MAPPATLTFCLTTGHLHKGKPIGGYGRFVDQSGSIRYYNTKPPPGGKGKDWENIVMLLSDVLGLGNQNTLLVADNFAANGYTVLVPDLFGGDAVPCNYPVNYDMAAWQARHPTEGVMRIVQRLVESLRKTAGTRFVAGVGYSVSARYVLLGLGGWELFDVGYVAHPKERFVADEVLRIKKPLCVVLAGHDGLFDGQARRDMERQLKHTTAPYQMTVYSSVKHGFAVECNVREPMHRFAMEQAFNQAIQWIKHYHTEGSKYVSNT